MPREPPCIWVLAGVLNYRLCDRAYECEGCELFHALTGRHGHAGKGVDLPETGPSFRTGGFRPSAGSASWVEDQVTAHLYHVLGDCQLHTDRYYRPPHFWLLDEGERGVRVGLASHVLRILSPIDDITTPGIGLHLKRDQSCGWIVRGGLVISLSMPISGVVSAVNRDISGTCGTRGTRDAGGSREAREDHGDRAAEGDPWLFRVEPGELLSEVDGLVRGEEMLLWYLDSIRTLKRYLREAVCLPGEAALGPVMADGGEREPSLEDVLGRGRFERLLEELAGG